MPKRQRLREVGEKKHRELEDILESAEKSGLYGKRAKDSGVRTGMNDHKQKERKKEQ